MFTMRYYRARVPGGRIIRKGWFLFGIVPLLILDMECRP